MSPNFELAPVFFLEAQVHMDLGTWHTVLLFVILMHFGSALCAEERQIIHSFIQLKTDNKLCNWTYMFLQQQLRYRKYNMKNMDEQNPVCFLIYNLYLFREALLTMHSYFALLIHAVREMTFLLSTIQPPDWNIYSHFTLQAPSWHFYSECLKMTLNGGINFTPIKSNQFLTIRFLARFLWVISAQKSGQFLDKSRVQYDLFNYQLQEFNQQPSSHFILLPSCPGMKILQAPCGSSSIFVLLQTVEHFSIKHFISDSWDEATEAWMMALSEKLPSTPH